MSFVYRAARDRAAGWRDRAGRAIGRAIAYLQQTESSVHYAADIHMWKLEFGCDAPESRAVRLTRLA